ncbi:hypothetical protein L9F63_019990, partial [Diploptera punctata]
MIAILLSAALLVSSTLATTFQKCDKGAEPLAVRVRGCDEPPCQLAHGDHVHAEVDFRVDHEVSHMTPKAVASVSGVNVNYPLAEKEACNSLINSKCPLKSGDVATYLLELPISSAIPSVEGVTVFLNLTDADSGDILSCFGVKLR